MAFANLREVLAKHPRKPIELYIFGFSRGAATSLAFVNRLFDQTWFHLGRNKIPLTKVKFVGLFDTVASIGVPGIETFNGYDLSAHPSRIENILHITAMHEHRGLFDLISIRQGPNAPLPPGWVERPFPGVHSDVGGGYGPSQFRVNTPIKKFQPHASQQPEAENARFYAKDDFLSRIAGWIMYDKAIRYGAAFLNVRHHLPTGESQSLQSVHNPDNFKYVNEKHPVKELLTPGIFKTITDIHDKLHQHDQYHEISDPGKFKPCEKEIFLDFSLQESSTSKAQHALKRLIIPNLLIKLWQNRNAAEFTILINHNSMHFANNITPYMHNSLGPSDINWYKIISLRDEIPRDIYYHGKSQ